MAGHERRDEREEAAYDEQKKFWPFGTMPNVCNNHEVSTGNVGRHRTRTSYNRSCSTHNCGICIYVYSDRSFSSIH